MVTRGGKAAGSFGLALSLVLLCGCALGRSPMAPPLAAVPPPPQLDSRFDVVDAQFSELPGWVDGDHAGVLAALRQTCAVFLPGHARDDVDVDDRADDARDRGWYVACEAVMAAETDGSVLDSRSVLERYFEPVALSGPEGDRGLVTAYYEPTIAVRRAAEPPFVEPILGLPDDLFVLPIYDANGVRHRDEIYQRQSDGSLAAYPARAEIVDWADPGQVIAYGRLSDVTFLQIQGSGRLVFEDGEIVRAAFAQTNGLGFVSIVRELIARGEIRRDEASNARVKVWLEEADRALAREIVNANPRYVFFKDQPVGDPALGPEGHAGIALRSGVSIAIDPRWHDYGALYWIAPEGWGAPPAQFGLTQDKGAAILGALRADLFMGSGDAAGEVAARVQHKARWWALVPRVDASE